MMIRNAFVREEDERLILVSGIPAEWLEEGNELRFGPTATPWGGVSVCMLSRGDRIEVSWQAEWRRGPRVEVRPHGHETMLRRHRPTRLYSNGWWHHEHLDVHQYVSTARGGWRAASTPLLASTVGKDTGC